ncbi:MAG: hypothetical protein RR898_00005 [Clostridium sp.]|uniref:hypothetical protein n=1 Tax=Clostridium sp. TaxID=1506 RepID=UPI002FCBF0F0
MLKRFLTMCLMCMVLSFMFVGCGNKEYRLSQDKHENLVRNVDFHKKYSDENIQNIKNMSSEMEVEKEIERLTGIRTMFSMMSKEDTSQTAEYEAYYILSDVYSWIKMIGDAKLSYLKGNSTEEIYNSNIVKMTKGYKEASSKLEDIMSRIKVE